MDVNGLYKQSLVMMQVCDGNHYKHVQGVKNVQSLECKTSSGSTVGVVQTIQTSGPKLTRQRPRTRDLEQLTVSIIIYVREKLAAIPMAKIVVKQF